MVASEMTSWAIDLGNTHTRVARWDETADRPKLLELPAICRRPGGEEPLEAPRLVPSATFIPDRIDWSTRFGRWPFVAKRWFYGCEAVIGRPAVEANSVIVNPGFVPNFKLFLDREATRVLARAGRRSLAARDVARCFVRELLAEIKRTTGERIRDVVLTTPVEAFETYRAELLRITAALGIRTVRWVDEPVAAALGYGLSLTQERLILVHDFGGGTLHLALVAMSGKGARRGESSVVAKEGRAIGGKLVDAWLLDEACRRAGFSPPRADDQDDEVEFWRRLMLVEACRVKETVFFGRPATFLLAPPPYARGPAAPGGEKLAKIELSRDDLVALLRAKGLFHTLEECIDGVLTQAARLGISERNIEDVLMVGGSTLLPEVYPTFERRFGREHVRAWQPFEAVAFGACAFAAGRADKSDFIVHDYAFMTYDPKTNEPEYTTIVPGGTRFPTPPDLWKRQLVPTCSLGEPETFFKLVICEVGRGREGDRKFVWDREGTLHQMSGDRQRASEKVVVPLNEASPTLGYLDPPHSPRDKRPRLEIAFGVNTDRWLCASVFDLHRQRFLMKDASVVRLV